MDNKKMTKRDYLEVLQGIVAQNANEEEKEMLLEFLDKQIDSMVAKAEKAKARKAEKKAEGDALRLAVETVLTTEPQTIEDILSQVDGEEVTKAKVTARLTALCKAGLAEKVDVTVEKRKLKAYRLIAE